jgi:hypothetical protein
VNSFGGTICHYQDVDLAWLQRLAQSVLTDLGLGLAKTALCIETHALARAQTQPAPTQRRTMKFIFVGIKCNKESQRSLARRLSEHLLVTVHSFSFTDDGEAVASFAGGRRVGGDELSYEDVSLDEDSDEAFAEQQAQWPLGHLACVLGITREDLTYQNGAVRLSLDVQVEPCPLWQFIALPAPKESAPT